MIWADPAHAAHYRPPTTPAGGYAVNGHGDPMRPTSMTAPGGLAPVTSGRASPSVYLPVAEAIRDDLLATRPDLGAYPHALAAWSVAEAVAALLRRHLAEVTLTDPDGELRLALLAALGSAEASAAKRRAVLGLDPAAEATLAAKRASVAATVSTVDLGALAARGAAALGAGTEAARSIAAPAPPPSPPALVPAALPPPIDRPPGMRAAPPLPPLDPADPAGSALANHQQARAAALLQQTEARLAARAERTAENRRRHQAGTPSIGRTRTPRRTPPRKAARPTPAEAAAASAAEAAE